MHHDNQERTQVHVKWATLSSVSGMAHLPVAQVPTPQVWTRPLRDTEHPTETVFRTHIYEIRLPLGGRDCANLGLILCTCRFCVQCESSSRSPGSDDQSIVLTEVLDHDKRPIIDVTTKMESGLNRWVAHVGFPERRVSPVPAWTKDQKYCFVVDVYAAPPNTDLTIHPSLACFTETQKARATAAQPLCPDAHKVPPIAAVSGSPQFGGPIPPLQSLARFMSNFFFVVSKPDVYMARKARALNLLRTRSAADSTSVCGQQPQSDNITATTLPMKDTRKSTGKRQRVLAAGSTSAQTPRGTVLHSGTVTVPCVGRGANTGHFPFRKDLTCASGIDIPHSKSVGHSVTAPVESSANRRRVGIPVDSVPKRFRTIQGVLSPPVSVSRGELLTIPEPPHSPSGDVAMSMSQSVLGMSPSSVNHVGRLSLSVSGVSGAPLSVNSPTASSQRARALEQLRDTEDAELLRDLVKNSSNSGSVPVKLESTDAPSTPAHSLLPSNLLVPSDSSSFPSAGLFSQPAFPSQDSSYLPGYVFRTASQNFEQRSCNSSALDSSILHQSRASDYRRTTSLSNTVTWNQPMTSSQTPPVSKAFGTTS